MILYIYVCRYLLLTFMVLYVLRILSLKIDNEQYTTHMHKYDFHKIRGTNMKTRLTFIGKLSIYMIHTYIWICYKPISKVLYQNYTEYKWHKH